MSRAVVLFTRDLRVRDHPALAAATHEHREVVPLFVLDDRLLLTSANRTAFLLDSLSALRDALDGSLAVRRGRPAQVVAGFDPDVVYLTNDWSAYARRRHDRLRSVAEVRASPGPRSSSRAASRPPGATTTGCSLRTGGPGARWSAGRSRHRPRPFASHRASIRE